MDSEAAVESSEADNLVGADKQEPENRESAPEKPAIEKQESDGPKGFKAVMRYAVKRYLIDAFSGMALGLFCTLIAGTIVGQIGTLIGDNPVGNIIKNIGLATKMIMGAGIGVGIAHSLKAGKLTSFTAAAAGMIGANITNIFALSGVHIYGASTTPSITIGDPVAAYFAAVFCIEISRLVEGKTPIDIVLIPLLGIAVGSVAAMALGIPFGILFALLGRGMAYAIKWNSIIFGIIIAAVMGLLLTLPTSSAAFGVMLFGVGSFRENGWGGVVSQGIGTSMLQIPNLAKNPRILLPAVAASVVAGPLSSAAFGLLCDSTGAGMGTAGLVGVIQTFSVSLSGGLSWWYVLIGVLVCYILVPGAVALGVSELMRKFGWIRKDDMKLPK